MPADPRDLPPGAASSAGERTPPRGRRSWLAIPLGALSGLVVCGLALGALYLSQGRPPSPATTAQTLCADLRGQHYAALYALLAPSLRQSGTPDQFAASQRQLDILRGKVLTCSYTVEHSDAAQAELRVTLTRASAGASSGTVALQYADGNWSIVAYDASVV
jgi:hypothetical protein